MRLEEQYTTLMVVKKEINELLKDLDFKRKKELILWLAKSSAYQKLKSKDSQLVALEIFCKIWIDEKKRLESLGISRDVFEDVDSLDMLEQKFLTLKFGVLRLETMYSEDCCQQFVDEIIEKRISSVALAQMIEHATWKREENFVKLCRLLKSKHAIMEAILLLEEARRIYKHSEQLLLELADCWIMGQYWEKAYECLIQIEHPNEEEKGLLKELRGRMNEAM